ncbi:MAG: hypothetical protein ACHP91_13975, partial [Burkholderiales bacterium]
EGRRSDAVRPHHHLRAPRAQKIAVGKRCGAHSTSQRFINKRLVDAARTVRRSAAPGPAPTR